MLTLCMTLNGSRVTQYTGWNFNSFCVFNGKTLAAGDSGLFLLEGNTDNGTKIDAYFETPTTDLGSPRQKRLRRIHLGYESAGNLSVTTNMDEGIARTETLVRRVREQYQQGTKVRGNRSQKGRYLKVKVANVSGCDFSVDSIIPEVVELAR